MCSLDSTVLQQYKVDQKHAVAQVIRNDLYRLVSIDLRVSHAVQNE